MALHNRRDRNREAIERFANCFDPPLNFNRTEAIGGLRVTNAWVAAYHDPDTELGVTAVAFGAGQFKCWLEALGTDNDADELGRIMAEVVQGLRLEEERSGLFDPAWASGSQDWDLPPHMPPQRGITYPGDDGSEPPEVRERKAADYAAKVEADADFRAREAVQTGYDPGLLSNRIRAAERLVEAEFPNPQLIDMMELSAQERHALVTRFPNLAFCITAGQRFCTAFGGNVADDRAGYCTADQLAAVRAPVANAVLEVQGQRRSRLAPRRPLAPMSGGVGLSPAPAGDPGAPGEPLPIMGAAPKPGCEHNWARNSIGDGATCSKCGGFERRRNTRERSAAENAERKLRDLEESRQAACERGEHEFVAPAEREYGVCAYCGADEPRPQPEPQI